MEIPIEKNIIIQANLKIVIYNMFRYNVPKLEIFNFEDPPTLLVMVCINNIFCGQIAKFKVNERF